MACVVMSTGYEIELDGDLDHIFRVVVGEVYFAALEEGVNEEEARKRVREEIDRIVKQLPLEHLFPMTCHLLCHYIQQRYAEAANKARRRAEAQRN